MRVVVSLAELPIGFHKLKIVLAMPVDVGSAPPPSWCGRGSVVTVFIITVVIIVGVVVDVVVAMGVIAAVVVSVSSDKISGRGHGS